MGTLLCLWSLASVDLIGQDSKAFRQAMSTGLAALARGEYEAAHRAFEQAKRLEGDAAAAEEGLAMAAVSLQTARVVQHQRRALEFAKREQWAKAADQYEAALALAPQLSSARRMAPVARDLADLHQQLDFHLGNAKRLSAHSVLGEAEILLERAKTQSVPGPELQKKIGRLADIIDTYKKPISVTLTSDNKTEILLQRVGRLGRFETHQLDLRPGNYTLVGSRGGYRDVRVTFTVEPGKPPTKPISIRCEDKI